MSLRNPVRRSDPDISPPGPVTAGFEVNGWSHRLTVWSPEAWEAIPEGERPEAGEMDRPGWRCSMVKGDPTPEQFEHWRLFAERSVDLDLDAGGYPTLKGKPLYPSDRDRPSDPARDGDENTRSSVGPAELARFATDEAILQFDRARERYERGRELAGPFGKEPVRDLWTSVLGNSLIDAEGRLTRTILAWEPGFQSTRFLDADEAYQPARAVKRGGRIFLAVPDPNMEPGQEKEGQTAMHLAILDPARIVDLDS